MTNKVSKTKGESFKYRPSYTRMRVRNHRLIIGVGSCHQCHGHGTVLPTFEKPCEPCAGKGLISYARFDRVCHKCKGHRTRTVYGDDAVTCPRCKGVNSKRFEKGERNDIVHPRIVARIPSKVYRLSFKPTETELKSLRNHMSTLYDCGHSRKLRDADILKGTRPAAPYAYQISKPDGRLALHFGLFVTPDVRIHAAVFDEDDVAWIETRNKEAEKEARRRRRAAKKCCPTCQRPFKTAA